MADDWGRRKGGPSARSSAEFKGDVDRFIDTHWDSARQTKAQIERVTAARTAPIDAHREERRLTYAEAAKVGNAIKTIANDSHDEHGPR